MDLSTDLIRSSWECSFVNSRWFENPLLPVPMKVNSNMHVSWASVSKNPKLAGIHLLNMLNTTEKYLHSLNHHLMLSTWKPEKYIQVSFASWESSACVINKKLKKCFHAHYPYLLLIIYWKDSLSLCGLYGFFHYLVAQLFTLPVLTRIQAYRFTLHIT